VSSGHWPARLAAPQEVLYSSPVDEPRVRVMIVDDHPMWRDAVARDLDEAGFSVVAAVGEGEQALRVAAPVRPDVVILDLHLPDIPGVRVTVGEFVEAVHRTAAGDAVFSPGLAGLVLGEYRRLAVSPAPDTPRLTDREAEILQMVGTGLSYKQIAERLVISHRTVQNHVQNTLGKLHLHNRVELVRYAIEHGLDSAPG
jgi:DNA-binding NarL/FixJ family response regulator